MNISYWLYSSSLCQRQNYRFIKATYVTFTFRHRGGCSPASSVYLSIMDATWKGPMTMMNSQHVAELTRQWENDSRWNGIKRSYSAEDVLRLRGSVQVEYTLARLGAERLWALLHSEPYVAALGALTGNQAVQQVKAGLQAIYLSGWQVAADANLAGQMYPDQSLYPANSG